MNDVQQRHRALSDSISLDGVLDIVRLDPSKALDIAKLSGASFKAGMDFVQGELHCLAAEADECSWRKTWRDRMRVVASAYQLSAVVLDELATDEWVGGK